MPVRFLWRHPRRHMKKPPAGTLPAFPASPTTDKRERWLPPSCWPTRFGTQRRSTGESDPLRFLPRPKQRREHRDAKLRSPPSPKSPSARWAGSEDQLHESTGLAQSDFEIPKVAPGRLAAAGIDYRSARATHHRPCTERNSGGTDLQEAGVPPRELIEAPSSESVCRKTAARYRSQRFPIRRASLAAGTREPFRRTGTARRPRSRERKTVFRRDSPNASDAGTSVDRYT